MWRVSYWEPGTDRGGLIAIRKERVPNDSSPIGLNPVIANELEESEGNPNSSESSSMKYLTIDRGREKLK